jgi:hypothetical protein
MDAQDIQNLNAGLTKIITELHDNEIPSNLESVQVVIKFLETDIYCLPYDRDRISKENELIEKNIRAFLGFDALLDEFNQYSRATVLAAIKEEVDRTEQAHHPPGLLTPPGSPSRASGTQAVEKRVDSGVDSMESEHISTRDFASGTQALRPEEDTEKLYPLSVWAVLWANLSMAKHPIRYWKDVQEGRRAEKKDRIVRARHRLVSADQRKSNQRRPSLRPASLTSGVTPRVEVDLAPRAEMLFAGLM